MQFKHLTTTLLAATTLLSSSSAAPADAATTVVVTSTSSASASASASATPSPPSFALGTLYNRGGYSTQYIIWSPTVNTTASQCNSPYNIAVTSAYTGPNHPFCNYPFDFDGYKNLTLQCGSSSSTFETGQVTGILQSNGVKTWSCTYTPYTKVQPYRCPLAGVDPGYLPQLSQFYICQ